MSDRPQWMKEAEAEINSRPRLVTPLVQIAMEIIAEHYAAEDARVRKLSAQLTALRILLEARSWGASLGAIAEGEPELVALVDAHDAYIRNSERAKPLSASSAGEK